MDRLPIAVLTPELPALESKQFKAVVSLIWPYSSSTRQFALLLAEPDFRLRHKKGQVRARFAGSSAKALAATGVGIGDEVVLGLRGAQFVHEDTDIRTPGRSIDWELSFSQTLVVQISRGGHEIANLDIINAAPTPAPQSPVRPQPLVTPLRGTSLGPSEGQRFSSPAFLKRARLSDGPFFEAGYDPLLRDMEDVHDKKRRRKSYRDWSVWTYSARTPSPEKDDVEVEEDYDDIEASPTRQPRLPATPVSPPKPELYSVAGLPLGHAMETGLDNGQQEEEPHTVDAEFTVGADRVSKDVEQKLVKDDFVRDADYYDLYAGPNEFPPSDTQYIYGGDTEVNTEEEDVTDLQYPTKELSATEPDFEEADGLEHAMPDDIEVVSDIHISGVVDLDEDVVRSTGEHSLIEIEEHTQHDEHAADPGREHRAQERPGTQDDSIIVDDAPQITMPPPTLSFLQTDFSSGHISGMLTPIGKEPLSPTLKPLDSSTLPMPSPFPGDRDGDVTSFFDHPGLNQQLVQSESAAMQEQEPSSEASYIVESSFYSSASASNSGAFHATHESAFTDVRFTFGMDGSTFSRQRALSGSPTPQDAGAEDDESEENVNSAQTEDAAAIRQELTLQDETAQQQTNIFDQFTTQDPQSLLHETVHSHISLPSSYGVLEETSQSIPQQPGEPEVIVLSSGSGSGSESSDDESQLESDAEEADATGVVAGEEYGTTAGDLDETDDVRMIVVKEGEKGRASSSVLEEEAQDIIPSSGTQRSVVTTEIIDLGSGCDSESDDGLPANEPSTFMSDNVQIESSQSGAVDTGNADDNERTKHDILLHSQIPDQNPRDAGPRNDDTISARAESLRELVSVEAARDHFTTVPTPTKDKHELATYMDPAQTTALEAEHYEDGQLTRFADDEPPMATNNTDDLMLDAAVMQEATQQFVAEMPQIEERHPDIKMESIEDETPVHLGTQDSFQLHDDDESIAGPTAELLIRVPEGHKMGELAEKAVPATGPARNTRSKTKASKSPVKDDTPALELKTRGRRSKTSMASVARTTPSPFNARTRSTVSPVKDAMPASSYSLRSQSKMLSPTKSTTPPSPSREREHPHKRRVGQSLSALSSPLKELFPEDEQLPFESIEFPDTIFGLSQELGTSQGKFANVSFVRDSEESSPHHEHSISTVPYSDDDGMRIYTNSSDPVESITQIRDSDLPYPKNSPTDLTPSPETRVKPPAKTQWKTEQQLSGETKSRTGSQLSYSFITNNASSSPSKAERSMMSSEAIPGSSQNLHGQRRNVYELSSESPAELPEDPDEATPKAHPAAGQVAYPELPLESQGIQIPSSPPPAVHDDNDSTFTSAHIETRKRTAGSPPPAIQSKFVSVDQQSLMNSNMPITPDATQLSFIESQSTFPASQMEQSLPMTPQLTQAISAGLRSFKADMGMEEVSGELQTKPISITKTTPRRSVNRINVASRSVSLSIHSEDLSDSEDEQLLATKAEPPSIGLSTPIAYYTPLKDLRFFLNRSSQFHSSSNPDVLALVTSNTTLPKKADKGPRHWNTTLHITDLSSHPISTTVQVFRPYSKALPFAEKGDVILLRAFQVKSLNHQTMLVSGEESAWCVWRYGKPIWGTNRGVFGEVRAREEVHGPAVEKGEGEWREVERLRGWWVANVKVEVEAMEKDGKSTGKGKVKANGVNRSEVINGDAES